MGNTDELREEISSLESRIEKLEESNKLVWKMVDLMRESDATFEERFKTIQGLFMKLSK